jgi:hypothetical protein
MTNKSKKKPDRKLVYAAVSVAILVVLGVIFLMVKQPKTEHTTLYEDINNRCSKDGISTLVVQKFVEVQVPKDEVDSYIKSAFEHGRCVYKERR